MTEQAVLGSPRSMRDRVEAMFTRDKIAAGILIVVLWLTVLFVLIAMWQYMSHRVQIVCTISAALLLLFNSASIVAMIRHYAEDKEHIYGVDIHHLDAGR